jgi:DnaJ-domain-containing protein 1
MVISRNELVEVESAIRSVSQQLYALLNKHALNDILNEKFVKLKLLQKIKQKSKSIKNARGK